MSKPFDDKDYTFDNIVIQLALMENHAVDGSVLDAGCQCVEGKHAYLLEGYSNEGASIFPEEKKKQFLIKLAKIAREARRTMEADNWDMNEVLRQVHDIKSGNIEHISVHESEAKCLKQVLPHVNSIEEARKVCASLH